MKDLTTTQTENLESVSGMKLLLNVDTQGQKVLDWASENHAQLERLLQANGALLIRGLKILSSKQFGQVLAAIFGEDLIDYSYRSTPRTELRGKVYTATEYHKDQTIPQHNENAYSNRWPMRIGFFCTQPSDTGGCTPISDSRKLYTSLPKELVEKFEARKIMYVRNYSDIDLPWSEVFQTDDRSVVEAFCNANGIKYEWFEDNALRTTQVNPAVAMHPSINEKIWFNQAHLFHITNLDPEIRNSLLEIMPEDRLPKNTYYGDGSPIEESYLDLIRTLYEETKISFPWQRGDLMLLDNMLYTHGREPFTGNRQVLVGMARPNEHAQAVLTSEVM